MSTNAKNTLGISGRIDRKTYDTEKLRQQYQDWDSLSEDEKLSRLDEVEPEDTETVYNVTTDRFHEYFVDNLDPSQTAAKDNITELWLGLGTDSASGTATSDTDLNNRVYEEEVTDVADNTKDLVASTFLDSGEGNVNDFDELGLFSGNPANLANADVFLLNHATFSAVTKDSTKSVTFDVTLTFSDV